MTVQNAAAEELLAEYRFGQLPGTAAEFELMVRKALDEERRLTVERIRERIKYARVGGREWSEVYAPQFGFLLDAELKGGFIR